MCRFIHFRRLRVIPTGAHRSGAKAIMVHAFRTLTKAGCGRILAGDSISARMYQMDQLLNLLTIERAKELRFRAGEPPLIVREAEQHPLEGPPIAGEDIQRLFRNLAGSRHMRELERRGTVQFVHTLPNRAPFVVRATMEKEDLIFEVW